MPCDDDGIGHDAGLSNVSAQSHAARFKPAGRLGDGHKFDRLGVSGFTHCTKGAMPPSRSKMSAANTRLNGLGRVWWHCRRFGCIWAKFAVARIIDRPTYFGKRDGNLDVFLRAVLVQGA